jgi:hypothetical protein
VNNAVANADAPHPTMTIVAQSRQSNRRQARRSPRITNGRMSSTGSACSTKTMLDAGS